MTTMKTKIYLAAAMAAMVGMTACEEDINIYPVENNTADQFYKNENEMNQAVMGIYAKLGRNGTNTDYPTDMYYQASESRSDNLYIGQMANAQRDHMDLRNFQVSATTGVNEGIYGRLYSLIANANTLLEKSSESLKRQRAEARFLRALAYFDLLRAYGDQPYTDHVIEAAEAKTMERVPVAEGYKMVIEDLQYAIENLDDFYTGAEAGRVGSVAASTLLGYVYVTMGGYPVNDASAYAKAVEVLRPIMSKVDSRWATNYADLFDLTKENKYDLFSVQFASGNMGLGSSYAAYCTTGSSAGGDLYDYFAWTVQGQDLRVDSALVDEMTVTGDLRKAVTIAEGYYSNAEHTADKLYERNIIIKMFGKNPDNGKSKILAWNDLPLNFPVLRPADAYLLYAEALVETGKANEALPYVNKVRQRAGLENLTTVTKADVMKERRFEFLGEGKRYFDLVRMGEQAFLSAEQAIYDRYNHKGMNASAPSKKDMLLPIPLVVMNINQSWQQNPGY